MITLFIVIGNELLSGENSVVMFLLGLVVLLIGFIFECFVMTQVVEIKQELKAINKHQLAFTIGVFSLLVQLHPEHTKKILSMMSRFSDKSNGQDETLRWPV